MRGTTLLAALLFALPAFAQDEEIDKPYPRVDEPTAEQKKEAVEALKAAAKDKRNVEGQQAAIERYGAYSDPYVVREVSKGLRSRDADVKLTAIEALGWHRNKEALKQLHRLYRRERKILAKQEELFAALFKAIGRHRSKTSLDVLGDKVFTGATDSVIKARVYGIGNIRKKKSIEMILKGMRLTGTSPSARGARTSEPLGMEYFRVALAVLTGEDFGGVSEEWQRWWRKNKNKFKMSDERPDVSQDIKNLWISFWGEPYDS